MNNTSRNNNLITYKKLDMMKHVIDYLLKNDLAEIPKKGRKRLKSIIIITKDLDTIRTNHCQTNFKRN